MQLNSKYYTTYIYALLQMFHILQPLKPKQLNQKDLILLSWRGTSNHMLFNLHPHYLWKEAMLQTYYHIKN